MMSKEDAVKFEEFQRWHEFASKCKHSYEKYVCIPTCLPACKLTDDACRYENCPKKKDASMK